MAVSDIRNGSTRTASAVARGASMLVDYREANGRTFAHWLLSGRVVCLSCDFETRDNWTAIDRFNAHEC